MVRGYLKYFYSKKNISFCKKKYNIVILNFSNFFQKLFIFIATVDKILPKKSIRRFYKMSFPVSDRLNAATSKIYNFEHDMAKKHIYIAKALSPVIAGIDNCIRACYDLAQFVEDVVNGIINILGSLASLVFTKTFEKYTFSFGARLLRYSITPFTNLFKDIVCAPFDFCFQTKEIFNNPQKVGCTNNSINIWLFPPKREPAGE